MLRGIIVSAMKYYSVPIWEMEYPFYMLNLLSQGSQQYVYE